MAEFVMKDLAAKAGKRGAFEIASAAVSREELGNPVYPPHLFDGHTFVDSHCCKGTTELVRMNFWHRKCLPHFSDSNFHTANSQS